MGYNKEKNWINNIEPYQEIPNFGFFHKYWNKTMYPPFVCLNTMQIMASEWETGPNDIFICTHQKVGTHLTKKYVVEILRNKFEFPRHHGIYNGDIGHDAIPWPEVLASQKGIDEFWQFINITKEVPRVWYNHWIPKDIPCHKVNSESKFIIVHRNPKSALISQYFFYKNHPKLGVIPNLEIKDFFSLFVEEQLYFGSYFQFLNEWKHTKLNMLFLDYESLVSQKIESVKRIALFLLGDLDLADETIHQIAAATEFDNMKSDIIKNPRSFHFDASKFFRSGKTNDWVNYLTPEMAVQIDKKQEEVAKRYQQ